MGAEVDSHTRNKRASQATLRPEPIKSTSLCRIRHPKFDNLILQSDTNTVNAPNDPPEKASVWQRTPHANLIRYQPSEVYFARFRVKGKLFRRSLKTNVITVARLRLADIEKSERQRAQSAGAVAAGKMTFGDFRVLQPPMPGMFNIFKNPPQAPTV